MKVINQWMIYGANGYTGHLIVEEAVSRGHQPLVAGRSESSVLSVAEEFDLEYKVFDLDHPQKVKQHIEGVGLILNCAGPFSKTASALREACLDLGIHYLDITGEIPVLEASYATHDRAREKGVVIVSGVGFDVVPTDLLSNLLHKAYPAGNSVRLAFAGEGGLSPGTAKTMVQMMHERGKVRKNGEMITVPLAYKVSDFKFSDATRTCMTIPWGDIATVFYSTGIPNIEVYTAIEADQVKWVRGFNRCLWLLKYSWVQNFLNKVISKYVHGPDKEERETGFMRLVGHITDGVQETVLTMNTPEGYDFTKMSALLYVEHILSHKILPGAYTPCQAIEPEVLVEMDIFDLVEDHEKTNAVEGE
jgi:short subunit dehydrogenase-like uncharacterized protein